MNYLTHTKRAALALVAFAMLGVAACTDLEEEVFNDLTVDNFPQNEEQIDAAVAGVYTKLLTLGSHNTYTSIQEVSSDEMVIPFRTKTDWEDGRQWLNLHRHEQTGAESSLGNAWNDMFQGVSFANELLTSLRSFDGSQDIEPAVLTGYRAELRALRALYYYYLIDMFGDVPLVTDETAFTPTPAATSRGDIYAFLVSELNDVSGDLTQDYDDTTYGRFTYWSAQALLAKLHLNAEVYSGTAAWSDAATAAQNVMNGPFSLSSDYFANFNADNDQFGMNAGEMILQVPYDEAVATGFNIQQMTLHYSSQATFDMQEQPWNGYCSMQEFYESYDDDDTRKGVSGNQQIRGNFFAGTQFDADGVTQLTDNQATLTATAQTEGQVDPDGPGVVFTPEINQLEPFALRQAGVRVGKYEIPMGVSQSNPTDWPIFRLGDIMLVRAEALWRQDANSSEALNLVNAVRSRSIDDDFDSLSADNILAERGREMFYEGTRRQDLIRFGKFNDAWQFKNASAGDRIVMPIPNVVLNVNSALEQNSGY